MACDFAPGIIHVLHGKKKIKTKMGIFRKIFYHCSHFVKRIFILFCFDRFSNNISSSKIFFCSRCSKDNSIRFIQCMLCHFLQSTEFGNTEKSGINICHFSFVDKIIPFFDKLITVRIINTAYTVPLADNLFSKVGPSYHLLKACAISEPPTECQINSIYPFSVRIKPVIAQFIHYIQ